MSRHYFDINNIIDIHFFQFQYSFRLSIGKKKCNFNTTFDFLGFWDETIF